MMKIRNSKGEVLRRVYGDTLSHAILHRANLRNADLKYAYLKYAYLKDADLTNADLKYADLSNADLTNADLKYADLTNADLKYADLSNADLTNADLSNADLKRVHLQGTIGNGKEIKNLNGYTYGIAYTKDVIYIGCEGHSLKEWEAFTDDEISRMDTFLYRSQRFWAKNKNEVLAKIKANPAE